MDYGDNFNMDIDEPSSMAMNRTNEHQQTGMILFFAVTILSATFVAICSARQYFEKCCARVHPCCSKMFCQENQEIHDAEQYPEDRFLAETLQRRFDEEERDRERLAKRKERRMWYEYYIKPWTMTVEKNDLFYAHRQDVSFEKQNQRNQEEGDGTIIVDTDRKQTSKSDEVLTDIDVEEVCADSTCRPCPQYNICDKDNENASLYLTLPSRCVDATCAFCLDDYEVGDEVVWSDLHCTHAFHKECLMQWLSKGKKRCPVCRHWFVPGSKIDDQKLVHGAAWQNALSEMEQREKAENEKNSKTNEQKIAATDLEQGIVANIYTLPSSQCNTTIIASESHHSNSGHDGSGCTISRRDPGEVTVSNIDDVQNRHRVTQEEGLDELHNNESNNQTKENKDLREVSIKSEEEFNQM